MASKILISLMWQGIYFLLLYNKPGGHCLEQNSFPLNDCEKDDIDLLLVADAMGDFRTIDARMKEQMSFFLKIVDMFSQGRSNASSGLQVSVATTLNSGPAKRIPFEDYENIGELKTKLENISVERDPTEPPASKFEVGLQVAQDVFSDSPAIRQNSTHVVVMVVYIENKPNLVEQISAHQSKSFDAGDFRLFVVMVGLTSHMKRGGVAYIKHTISFPAHPDFSKNQHFSMAICGRCSQGEVYARYQKSSSCYSWKFLRESVNWYDAANECAKDNAYLLTLETDEEIENFNKTTNISINNFLTGSVYRYYYIYLGLSRDTKKLAGRFQWVNGKPVITTRWGPKKPDGGKSHACAARVFYAPLRDNTGGELPSGISANDTETIDDFGWIDFGCGLRRAETVICEKSLNEISLQSHERLRVKPATNESYRNALRHADFLEVQGTIISVSAKARDRAFLKDLKERKLMDKFFSCDEGDYERIPYAFVCDLNKDCRNNRDEQECSYRECDVKEEFQCKSKHCIPRGSRCDIYHDCPDKSDEAGCEECKGFRCCDGKCLPKHWFLDGQIDCTQCSVGNDRDFDFLTNDEVKDNLGNLTTIQEGCAFICNYSECVTVQQLDRHDVMPCTGPEGPLDKYLGELQSYENCSVEGKKRWSPRCVYVKDRFDEVLGCRDMSHLHQCDVFKCPEGFVKCPNAYCIPVHMLQDGELDCPLGEDEQYIDNHICTGNFACSKSRVCVHPDLVCDGHPHCPEGDDELNCHPVPCKEGFLCTGGSVSLRNYDGGKPPKITSLAFIDSRIRFLNLSGVDLSLDFADKDRADFRHLVYVYLSGCHLEDTKGSFVSNIETLRTVRLLDLSYNYITKIPQTSIFTHMTNLRDLSLSHNKQLSHIHSNGLLPHTKTPLLERLDLSGTSISSLSSFLSPKFSRLHYLNLSSTNIHTLKRDSFPAKFTLAKLDLRFTSIETFEKDSLHRLKIAESMYTDNYKLCCPQVRGPLIEDHTCHTTQDAISSCSDLIGESVQRVILWLVGVLAILGNTTVFVYRLTHAQTVKRKAFSIFVINLSASDFLMGVYLLIIAGADEYYRGNYVFSDRTWRHSVLCRIAGFLSTLSSETSTVFIFLITLDRYLVLKFPLGKYNFTKLATTICVVGTWILGFLIALIPVLPSFEHWKIYSTNGVCLGLPLTTEKKAGWQYSVAIFVVFNFVMFIGIAYGQYLIYQAMSGNRMAKSAAVQGSSRRAQDVTVAKQLSLVALTDFLCWFPIGLMGLLALNGNKIGADAYAWSAVLVLPINSALNPVMYTIPILWDKWVNFRQKYSSSGDGQNAAGTGKGKKN